MKIKSIKLVDYKPIKNIEIDNLLDFRHIMKIMPHQVAD